MVTEPSASYNLGPAEAEKTKASCNSTIQLNGVFSLCLSVRMTEESTHVPSSNVAWMQPPGSPALWPPSLWLLAWLWLAVVTSLWGLWIFQHRSVIKRQSPLILIKRTAFKTFFVLFFFHFFSPEQVHFFLVQRCFWYRNVQNAFNNRILMQFLWKKPFGKR